MTRDDCKDWLKEHHLPVPGKSSCLHCPYHSNEYWQELKDYRPAEWARVIAFDDDLRNGRLSHQPVTRKGELYLHYTCRPMSEIEFRSPEEEKETGLANTDHFCESGYCMS